MLRHDVKVAWRNLKKYRLQSVISVVAMAVGFVAFIFGGYWWEWENRFDAFHPESDRLFAVVTYGMVENADGSEAGLNQLHRADADYFRTSVPELEVICPVGFAVFPLEEDGNIREYVGCCVDSSFFRLFSHRFLDGGYRGVVADGKSVFLTRRMAMQFFGTLRCSGRDIHLGRDRKGREEIFRVAGVIEDYPTNSEFAFDLLVYDVDRYNPRGRTATYVLLKKAADVKKTREKIAAHKSVAVDPYGIDEPSQWRFALCSLPEVHLTCHPELGNRFRNIRILAFAGLLAFISALMNHLVLFTGQQQRKEREYVTRVSLGSSLGEMVCRMCVEVMLPLLMALVLAWCMIEVLFPFYQDYTTIREGEGYSGSFHQMERGGMLLGTLKYMVVACAAFLAVSAVQIYFMLKRQRRQLMRREDTVHAALVFRRVLIVGQIFIGTLFFISSLGLYKQLYFLTHTDLGIELRNVAQISLGFRTADKIDLEQLRRELQGSPAIEAVTATNEPVLSPHGIYYGNEVGFVPVEGRSHEEFKARGMEDYFFTIEENFFDFFGIRLLKGGLITEKNPYDYVVNETGYRELGFPDLPERRLLAREGGGQQKVAGVVGDYHYAPLQYAVRKVFFKVERENLPYRNYHYVYFRYRPEQRDAALGHARKVMKKYDRGEVEPEKLIVELTGVMEEFNRPEKVIFTLFCILAVLCVLISSFGIYSLVALSAEQRRKEIAIRKVNGATFRNMIGVFLKEYFYLMLLGAVLASVMGYRLVSWWLETYAHHTDLRVWLFAGVFLVVAGIVAGAVALQVRKAMEDNPAEALKKE